MRKTMDEAGQRQQQIALGCQKSVGSIGANNRLPKLHHKPALTLRLRNQRQLPRSHTVRLLAVFWCDF